MSNWKIQGKLKKGKPLSREKDIIASILKNRKIPPGAEKEFFDPPNPLDIKLKDIGLKGTEITKAIKRINRALDNKESIVVYGDYDADGVCATAIIWEVLHGLTDKVMPYLPHRVEEGYGLSKKGIDAVIKMYKPNLIITVDNGITAKEEITYAKKKKIDVIVTDHHIPPKLKPKAEALVHSTKISGAGVAWFLARELLKKLGRKTFTELEEKLGLCAIGTVSDVLPVIGINRSIIAFGIDSLRKTQRPGLIALFKDAGINPGEIETYHIAYMIGPRINASGRLTSAMDSLRLLCTRSYARGYELSGNLGLTNRKRQKITEETLLHAREFLEKTNKGKKEKLLFISHSSYNQGVIGLVAGKLVEEYYRPAIVISQGEIYSKASARSISGFNIISLIRETGNLLVDCGGHPMAAGFTVETVKIEILKKKLLEITGKKLTDDLLVKKVNVDCEIDFSDISFSLFDKIAKFKPFGLGNPEALFCTKNLQIIEARIVGKTSKHLKLRLKDKKGYEFSAIAFGKADLYPKLNVNHSRGGRLVLSVVEGDSSGVEIIYSLTKNNWNGEQLELKIKDISI